LISPATGKVYGSRDVSFGYPVEVYPAPERLDQVAGANVFKKRGKGKRKRVIAFAKLAHREEGTKCSLAKFSCDCLSQECTDPDFPKSVLFFHAMLVSHSIQNRITMS
jgi:hypothetical protein